MLLKAKDVSNRAIKLEPNNTLKDARDTMLRYNISRVVIAQRDKLFGIITEKDITRFLYKNANLRRLDQVKIDEVMSKIPVTVNEETDLDSSTKLMLEKQVSSLIVVDSKNIIKGIFTKSDLVRVYSIYYTGRNKVEDYMSTPVLTVSPDDPSLAALSMMASHKVSRVVVVHNKKPIGILTSSDFMNVSPYFSQRIYESGRPLAESEVWIPSGVRRVFLVKDLIKREPIVVLKDSDLAEAAKIMVSNLLSGLPVVDKNYELAGIVTRTDIVRALTPD